MLAISFLNPLLLWGVGLASIPLIIHILNKRRYRIVHWAAMEFLLRAFKENRRRIRFEQLLLLLLRMAAVALLAFLLARPKASSEGFGVFGRSVVHHVMILDDSGSMGEAAAAGSSFDSARQGAVSMVETLARERSGDLVTLLRSSSQAPDIANRPATLKLVADVKDLLQAARPTPDRFELAVCLERVTELVSKLRDAEQADKLYLHVLSDFKGADLIGEEGKLDEAILKALRVIGPQRVFLTPCGRSAETNLAVVDVRLKEPLAIKNLPAGFEVVVRNLGREASGETELGFSIDGGARRVLMVPPLAPGAQHAEVFRTPFATAGSHWVEADLPKDRMPIDDRRALAFPVVESARVLLVDGDPGESEERSETFYLKIAFDPTDDASAGIAVTRIDDNEVSGRDFVDFDLVVLANVANLDDESATRLDAYVKGGGGLVLFTGDQVDPAVWDRLLWKDGAGLLPAPLRDTAGDMDRPDQIVLRADTHPMFGEIQEELASSLTFVDVGRYHTTGSEAEGIAEGQVPAGTEVLMRVGHEGGPPLLTEKSYGKGRVALCLTTADASWTPWASNPSYLVVARLIADHVMRREDLKPFNLDARGSLVRDMPAAGYLSGVRLVAARSDDEEGGVERGFIMAPRPDAPDKLRLEAGPVAGRVWPAPGCYKLVLQTSDNREEILFFAVNPWEREGEPVALEGRALRAMLPKEIAERTEIRQPGTAQADMLSDEGEIWRALALAVLAAMLLETLLAWRIGRR